MQYFQISIKSYTICLTMDNWDQIKNRIITQFSQL